MSSQVVASDVLTAEHGQGKDIWPMVALKLNAMPLFDAGVNWTKAREHFNLLVARHKPAPKTGADNEPYTEMDQLLDDVKQRTANHESAKQKKKDIKAAKDEILVDDGKRIRDASAEALACKPKAEKTANPAAALTEYLVAKGKTAEKELELRAMELEERKAERLAQQQERQAMLNLLVALTTKFSN
jgi:hypothetical protein